jgi:3'-phosphoadenosine 5'-phosphosulfate (PAPS) 3'-phosphatase
MTEYSKAELAANLADWGRALADLTEEAAAVILPYLAHRTGRGPEGRRQPGHRGRRAGERLILRRLSELFPGVPAISEEYASEFGDARRHRPALLPGRPGGRHQGLRAGRSEFHGQYRPDRRWRPRGRRDLRPGDRRGLVHHGDGV